MGYAAAPDLKARLGEAVFDEIYGVSTRADLSDLTAAADDLAAASAEIDGAVAARYRLPVAGTAARALLKDWCLTLAEERAFARAAGGAWAEKVKSRVEQVRKYLEMVRDGTFRLAGEIEDTAGRAAFAHNAEPVFDRKKMEGF